MKKITLILFLSVFFTQAQINRFIYEYKFIPNINEKDTVRKEMMLLDIDAKGSKYYSRDRFVQDSITKADLNRQMASGSRNLNVNRRERNGRINYKVVKEYPDFKVFLIDRVGQDIYKIAEDESISWKILPETQKIGEYDTQKATANFGGREWIAWFSKDIPFQDGPYKLHGLPGLIIKAEDTTGSHIMTLLANKKVRPAEEKNEASTNTGIIMLGIGNKEIEVTEKQFKKIWQDYLSDPAKNMRQMMMGNSPDHKVEFRIKTADGREISDINEIYRNMEKRVKESEAKNNNRIEPSLYNK